MITNNFKTYMALILTANSNGACKGVLPVVDTAGNTRYAANNVYNSMPSETNTNLTLNANERGISFGTGNTTPTANDTNLEEPITSGLAAMITRFNGLDDNGNPFLRFDIVLSNTSDSAITVKEIGYKQYLRCSDTLNGTTINSRSCLLDRSIFASPVTIPVDDYVIIRYTLKTIISAGS